MHREPASHCRRLFFLCPRSVIRPPQVANPNVTEAIRAPQKLRSHFMKIVSLHDIRPTENTPCPAVLSFPIFCWRRSPKSLWCARAEPVTRHAPACRQASQYWFVAPCPSSGRAVRLAVLPAPFSFAVAPHLISWQRKPKSLSCKRARRIETLGMLPSPPRRFEFTLASCPILWGAAGRRFIAPPACSVVCNPKLTATVLATAFSPGGY